MKTETHDIFAQREAGCPVFRFQHLISGKYKLRILWDLQHGPLRYGEVKKGLVRDIQSRQEIAPRVLSRELKSLVDAGLLERTDYQVVPPKVEYRLTPAGQSLVPIIAQMHQWGMHFLVTDNES